mgnify:CR=1 FL=1
MKSKPRVIPRRLSSKVLDRDGDRLGHLGVEINLGQSWNLKKRQIYIGQSGQYIIFLSFYHYASDLLNISHVTSILSAMACVLM